MLYKFLYGLRDVFGPFNVCKYITFRAAASAITTFLAVVLLCPMVTRRLSALKVNQKVRKDECPGLKSFHNAKEGLPTMGGLLLIAAISFSLFLWADLQNRFVALGVAGMLSFGCVGFLDDYLKVVRRRSKGLAIKTKLLLQAIVAFALGMVILKNPIIDTTLDVPFFKDIFFDMGPLFLPFVMLVLMGTANAVNLTDGLDGLAAGCVFIVTGIYAIFVYVSGHIKFAEYLRILYLPGMGEVSIFCASIIGACLGFLWFNSYPASLFMGDTGAMALGGALGIVAVMVKKELLLIVAGGIFVIEAVSVALQVASFRISKRRIFKVAPIHHHFQVSGLAEPKIVMRFWIVSALLGLLSLSTLKLK